MCATIESFCDYGFLDMHGFVQDRDGGRGCSTALPEIFILLLCSMQVVIPILGVLAIGWILVLIEFGVDHKHYSDYYHELSTLR